MARDGAAAEAFWRFSLMVYARPGVAEALIGLQDRAGHNVNIVLFGIWLGICEGRRLHAAGLTRAKAAVEDFDRDVVQQLRNLRRALKGAEDLDVRELRRRVLAVEIASERRVQARLAASLGGQHTTRSSERRAIAEDNLRLILGADFSSTEAEPLRQAIASH